MRSAWRDGDRTRAVELTPLGGGRWRAVVDGAELELAVEPLDPGRFRLIADDETRIVEITASGDRRFVRLGTLDFVLETARESARRAGGAHAAGLEAPMPGVVTRVMVAAGDAVRRGQPIVALEAMKMEHVIKAPRDGRVRALTAKVGEMVDAGTSLAEMDEETPPA